MAKVKKVALAFVLVAVAAVSLLCVGCSGGGAEIDGIYHYNTSEPEIIEQGRLLSTNSSSLTIYTDNTFAASALLDTLYSSDGTSYNPTYFGFYNVYGTYEVLSEDTDLNERTIKITEVNKIVTADGSFEGDAIPAAVTEVIGTSLVGKEMILTGDYELTENLFDPHILLAFDE